MQQIKKYFLLFKSHLFDMAIFSILIIVISACFMTYKYPYGQNELFYFGGQPLWATQHGASIVIFFIIVPIALIISYFFQTKINIWKPARYFILAAILVIDIIFLMNAMSEAIFAILSPVGAMLCIPGSMLLPIENGSISKTMESCVNAIGASVRLTDGAALGFFFIAGLISLVTLVTLIVARLITFIRALIQRQKVAKYKQ